MDVFFFVFSYSAYDLHFLFFSSILQKIFTSIFTISQRFFEFCLVLENFFNCFFMMVNLLQSFFLKIYLIFFAYYYFYLITMKQLSEKNYINFLLKISIFFALPLVFLVFFVFFIENCLIKNNLFCLLKIFSQKKRIFHR